MKTSPLLALALLVVPGALTCADFVPRMEIAAAATPITLLITADGVSPNLITASSDLTTWEDYMTIYSRVPSFRLVDLASLGTSQPRRFYRMRVQASQPTSAMRAGWNALGLTNYQFKFTRTCFCAPKQLSGTVTVKDGKVWAVADVPNPDLSQFRSVEDLFDLLEKTQLNADVVAVAFDSQLHFPTTIQIDYILQAADDEVTYQAGEIIPLD